MSENRARRRGAIRLVVDVLTPGQRRLNMSRIKGKDTSPELIVRRGLHVRGLRYRLHDRSLPGCPDLVFSSHRAVVMVHGCFWHFHGCALSKLPSTRKVFWAEKLARTRQRDEEVLRSLLLLDWRVLTIWECAIRGPSRHQKDRLLDVAEGFIRGGGQSLVLAGGGALQ